MLEKKQKPLKKKIKIFAKNRKKLLTREEVSIILAIVKIEGSLKTE
jgi:hypothetical protein